MSDRPLSERIGWFVKTLTEDGENADVFSVEWLTKLRDEIATLEGRLRVFEKNRKIALDSSRRRR